MVHIESLSLLIRLEMETVHHSVLHIRATSSYVMDQLPVGSIGGHRLRLRVRVSSLFRVSSLSSPIVVISLFVAETVRWPHSTRFRIVVLGVIVLL